MLGKCVAALKNFPTPIFWSSLGLWTCLWSCLPKWLGASWCLSSPPATNYHYYRCYSSHFQKFIRLFHHRFSAPETPVCCPHASSLLRSAGAQSSLLAFAENLPAIFLSRDGKTRFRERGYSRLKFCGFFRIASTILRGLVHRRYFSCVVDKRDRYKIES